MNENKARIPFDWLTALIFVILIMIAALNLQAANWADHLSVLAAIGIVGALAGIALARSLFSRGSALFVNMIYGFFIVGWELGLTLDVTLTWQERIFSLIERIGVFIGILLRNEPNQDPLMFVLLMGLLFWFLGSFGAWIIFRREGFWTGVILPGIVILVNTYYYVGRSSLDGYLILYSFLLLLLAMRVELWRRKDTWTRIKATVPSGTLFFISRAGISAAIVLVLLAWGGPAFAQSETAAELWEAISNPLQTTQRRIGDAFGGLRSPVAVAYDYYSDHLDLEAGTEPADTLVMTVLPEAEPSAGGRYYWRSRVFNIYDRGGWDSNLGENLEFLPQNGEISLPVYQGRELVKVTFAPLQTAVHVLPVPVEPLWLNRSVDLTAQSIAGGTYDLLVVNAQGVVREGEKYRAMAMLAIPRAVELREAGTDYPQWVLDGYLQVPDDITQRTRDLALEITRGQENVYDQASAITAWLRRNIQYNRVTDAAPPNVEPIDWFLFDYRVGFCNWYASAEVMLLRTLGIPARMSVGYAAGERNSETGEYEVRGGDAHAWPEVFFPGYGWIEFEPTGNQRALLRPDDPSSISSSSTSGGSGGGNPDGPEDFFANQTDQEFFDDGGFGPAAPPPEITAEPLSLALPILFATAGLVFIAIIWLLTDPISRASVVATLVGGLGKFGIRSPQRMRRISLKSLGQSGEFYARMSLWLSRLGFPLEESQTPYERAGVLETVIPENADSGWSIVQAYTAERFGGTRQNQREIRRIWRDLRPHLWLVWLQQRTPGSKKKSTHGTIERTAYSAANSHLGE
jgi:hypothetical protein